MEQNQPDPIGAIDDFILFVDSDGKMQIGQLLKLNKTTVRVKLFKINKNVMTSKLGKYELIQLDNVVQVFKENEFNKSGTIRSSYSLPTSVMNYFCDDSNQPEEVMNYFPDDEYKPGEVIDLISDDDVDKTPQIAEFKHSTVSAMLPKHSPRRKYVRSSDVAQSPRDKSNNQLPLPSTSSHALLLSPSSSSFKLKSPPQPTASSNPSHSCISNCNTISQSSSSSSSFSDRSARSKNKLQMSKNDPLNISHSVATRRAHQHPPRSGSGSDGSKSIRHSNREGFGRSTRSANHMATSQCSLNPSEGLFSFPIGVDDIDQSAISSLSDEGGFGDDDGQVAAMRMVESALAPAPKRQRWNSASGEREASSVGPNSPALAPGCGPVTRYGAKDGEEGNRKSCSEGPDSQPKVVQSNSLEKAVANDVGKKSAKRNSLPGGVRVGPSKDAPSESKAGSKLVAAERSIVHVTHSVSNKTPLSAALPRSADKASEYKKKKVDDERTLPQSQPLSSIYTANKPLRALTSLFLTDPTEAISGSDASSVSDWCDDELRDERDMMHKLPVSNFSVRPKRGVSAVKTKSDEEPNRSSPRTRGRDVERGVDASKIQEHAHRTTTASKVVSSCDSSKSSLVREGKGKGLSEDLSKLLNPNSNVGNLDKHFNNLLDFHSSDNLTLSSMTNREKGIRDPNAVHASAVLPARSKAINTIKKPETEYASAASAPKGRNARGTNFDTVNVEFDSLRDIDALEPSAVDVVSKSDDSPMMKLRKRPRSEFAITKEEAVSADSSVSNISTKSPRVSLRNQSKRQEKSMSDVVKASRSRRESSSSSKGTDYKFVESSVYFGAHETEKKSRIMLPSDWTKSRFAGVYFNNARGAKYYVATTQREGKLEKDVPGCYNSDMEAAAARQEFMASRDGNKKKKNGSSASVTPLFGFGHLNRGVKKAMARHAKHKPAYDRKIINAQQHMHKAIKSQETRNVVGEDGETAGNKISDFHHDELYTYHKYVNQDGAEVFCRYYSCGEGEIMEKFLRENPDYSSSERLLLKRRTRAKRLKHSSTARVFC